MAVTLHMRLVWLSSAVSFRLLPLVVWAVTSTIEGTKMRFNMPIDTDPQQQKAASPQVVVARSSSR